MQLGITAQGDYAVRAVLELARHYPNLRTNRQITEAMGLPRKFMSRILPSLVSRGLLISVAGPRGGYTLARLPSEISLLDVITESEGPVAEDKCVLGGGSCDWSQVCPLHETWSNLRTAMTSELAGVTLEHLTHIDRSIRAGTYEPPDTAPAHPTTPPRLGIANEPPSNTTWG